MAGRSGTVDVNRDVASTMRRTMAEVGADAYLVAEHLHDAHADLLRRRVARHHELRRLRRPGLALAGAGPRPTRVRFVKPFGIQPLRPTAIGRDLRAFNAIVPWRTLTANLNLLDSHDTARFRTIAGTPRAGAGRSWAC